VIGVFLLSHNPHHMAGWLGFGEVYLPL
jgi:hypothetical protein